MTNRTLSIIYTIKQKGTNDATITRFLMDYYNTDYLYSRSEIDQILRAVCIDYIETADDPIQEICRYFNGDLYSHVDISEHDRMINFLQQTQISSNGKYINGFRDWKENYNG